MPSQRDYRDTDEPLEFFPPHIRGAMPTKIIKCTDPPFEYVFVAYSLETGDSAIILTNGVEARAKSVRQSTT